MTELSSTIQICILILPESSMMSLSSLIDPLRAANRLARQRLFSWRLVSLSGQAIELTCGIKIEVDGALQAEEVGDIFMLLAGFNQDEHAPKKSLGRIRKAASKFNSIFAIEAGTWVLARAGIVNNHRVTTHWEDLENFSFAYPQLNVVGERFVIDRNIWTSGGASPSLDMLLHYLRSTQYKSLALDVANVFIYNESKSATDVQAHVSLDRLKRIEPRLAKVVEIMENSIEAPEAIRHLAIRVGISQRTLELLSLKHLGLSPSAHYLRLRLQAARKLVLDSNSPISEIAVRCGFNSQSAFSRAFSKRYQRSPIELRKRVV
ncbi:MAG: transcriptional regulator GlxA family with amidase domain [Arenicella sp.]|jgi:transcriptional regulator GlxA family with amidase domain